MTALQEMSLDRAARPAYRNNLHFIIITILIELYTSQSFPWCNILHSVLISSLYFLKYSAFRHFRLIFFCHSEDSGFKTTKKQLSKQLFSEPRCLVFIIPASYLEGLGSGRRSAILAGVPCDFLKSLQTNAVIVP
jgi:hypothetical protein